MTPLKKGSTVDCGSRSYTSQREDMKLMSHTGIFMELSLRSGQSLVLSLSCVVPVWGEVGLCGFACVAQCVFPVFSESTRPFAYSLNVLPRVTWRTCLFCFHSALLLSMSIVESFDPALASQILPSPAAVVMRQQVWGGESQSRFWKNMRVTNDGCKIWALWQKWNIVSFCAKSSRWYLFFVECTLECCTLVTPLVMLVQSLKCYEPISV